MAQHDIRSAHTVLEVAAAAGADDGHVDPRQYRTASAIPTGTADQRFAATMLRTAASELDMLAAGSSPYVADALVSLVLTAVAVPPAEQPGRELTDRAMDYCLAHLGDPRLSSEAVARVHHVSVRYLNRIMQPGGITLSAWIRSRRLEQIRRDLANPAYAHRSAARIAADWGILDAAHLSRSLRAEFGQSAAEIRRAARARPHTDRDSSTARAV